MASHYVLEACHSFGQMPSVTPRPARKRPSTEERDALMRAADAAMAAADYATARELAEQAVAAADRNPEGNVRSSARRMLALALLRGGRIDDAARAADEASRIAKAARAPAEEALAELALSQIERARGDYLAGLRRASRARSLSARAESPVVHRAVLGEYGLLLSRLGDGERARDLFDEAIALPETGMSATQAFEVMHGAAVAHRSAGRFGEALKMLDRAEGRAGASGLMSAAWPIARLRILTYTDVGATTLARAVLAKHAPRAGAPVWMRAQSLAVEATIALAAGERPEVIERCAVEGLALEGVDPHLRIALERLRASALLARGLTDDAERIAIELTTLSARGGAHALAALAMALAARATGRAEASLLRWLGALGLATRGVAARVEHEALAALAMEPDPVGAMARTGLAVVRARLLDYTPASLRPSMKRTLRQGVEIRSRRQLIVRMESAIQ